MYAEEINLNNKLEVISTLAESISAASKKKKKKKKVAQNMFFVLKKPETATSEQKFSRESFFSPF